MGIDVKIELNKKDRDSILAYPEEFSKALIPAFEKMIMKAEARSKEHYFKESGPVAPDKLTARTGTLRRIITHEVEKRSNKVYASLVADIEYAEIHEYGLGKFPMRAFLTPAIEDVLKDNTFESILMDEINKQIGS